MAGRFNPERQPSIDNSSSFSSVTIPTQRRALTEAMVKRWIAESDWALA